MVAQNKLYARQIAQKERNADHNAPIVDTAIGNCLNCGSRVSRCGTPFTADLKCPACGALNVYRESQQPVDLLLH